MAVKKNKQTEQEAQIKALEDENTLLRQTNHALNESLAGAGKTIADRQKQVNELAQDILAAQQTIGELYARVTRVVMRYEIGLKSVVRQGVVPPEQ